MRHGVCRRRRASETPPEPDPGAGRDGARLHRHESDILLGVTQARAALQAVAPEVRLSADKNLTRHQRADGMAERYPELNAPRISMNCGGS